MTRRGWLASFAASLSISRLRAAGTLTPLDEQAFSRMVASHGGKVLLVDFWATWCAPCREEFPKLVALHGAYKAKGLDLVAISCDEPEQEAGAMAFLKQQRPPQPFYVKRAKDDDQFINAIDRQWSGALPALFLFDRDGRQAKSFIGETDMKLLEATVKKLLAST